MEGVKYYYELDTIACTRRGQASKHLLKYRACRAASGCESECTVPGDKCHWMHEGNDDADRLAKLSKDVCEITDPTELLRDEGRVWKRRTSWGAGKR